jgi:peptidyl-dipeptidase Dcp
LYFVHAYYRDKKVVGVFVRFRAPSRINLHRSFDIEKNTTKMLQLTVTDEDNQLVAVFYADFFKKNGAWMTSFKSDD